MRAARKEGDLAAVAARLAEILQLDPGDADAIADLDEVQAQIKRVGAQRQVELAKAKQQAPVQFVLRPPPRRGAGDWTGAVTHWQEVLALAPDDTAAQSRLAAAQARLAEADREQQAAGEVR